MSLTKIVVTGGAGFIGSHLCRRLLAEQHAVVCVDNLITGSIGNIDDMLDHPRFTFVDADVTTEIPVEPPLTHVLHLASPASPVDYVKLPIETLMAGSVGTQHALELARRARARFLLASTSEVYATRRRTLNPRATGATSTRSDRDRCTTKPSATPKR